MPKPARAFFRYDRRLFAEVSWLIFALLLDQHRPAACERRVRHDLPVALRYQFGFCNR